MVLGWYAPVLAVPGCEGTLLGCENDDASETHNRLVVGRLRRSVALCTLWTVYGTAECENGEKYETM